MVTMAQTQSASNWRNMHTHADRTHSLTHLLQHSYNHFVQSTMITRILCFYPLRGTGVFAFRSFPLDSFGA